MNKINDTKNTDNTKNMLGLLLTVQIISFFGCVWCILLFLRRVWAARKPGCKQENREQGKKQGSTKVSASATATGACVYCNATRSRPFITKGSCVLWTPKSISTWDLGTWATTNVKHEPTSDALGLISHTVRTRKECNMEVSGEYGTICSREGSFRFIPQSCAPKLIAAISVG